MACFKIVFPFFQTSVSLKRLADFLRKDELDPENVKTLPDIPGTPAVVVSSATLSWGKDEPVCLKDVNLSLDDGSLVAVVGQVGSGKSSLVAGMLGLMEKLSGDVGVKGRVAYVPQVRPVIDNFLTVFNESTNQSINQSIYK